MAIPLRPIARRALAAQSDERLVRLLRDGHDPAFDEIVRRYRGPLVAFAAAITGTGRAEDVVQASLMRAHDALARDDREIRLRPWLFAIVRNGALNSIRDDPAWSELDPTLAGGPEAAAIAEQREQFGQLVDAICALPESQRRALVMREMEGVGHAEIAAQLQTSPTAVRGLIFRARTTLRNALGALVPLPLLRWLLEDAAVVAVGAAATAGAGGGGALAGGLLGKAAVGLTAVVIALGAGKVIHDRRGGDGRPGSEPATASAATGGARGGSGGVPAAATSRPEQAGEPGQDRRGAGPEGREERRDDDRDDRDGDDGDDGDGDGDGDGGGGGYGGGNGSSGGGSGGGGGDRFDDDDDPVEAEEPEVEEPEVEEPEVEEQEVDEPEVEEPDVEEPDVDGDEPDGAGSEPDD